MSQPEVEVELEERPGGAPRLRVAFAGEVPPGSLGNETARAMLHRLRAEVARCGLRDVILDLRQLRYRFGDALGACLIGDRVGPPGTRLVTVARGETALALLGLMELGPASLGARLVDSLGEARSILG